MFHDVILINDASCHENLKLKQISSSKIIILHLTSFLAYRKSK